MSAEKQTTVQNDFLAELKKGGATVNVFLVSGIKLVGTIEDFDQYAVALGGNTRQVILKSAISTISPAH